jgi:hypothetical protein
MAPDALTRLASDFPRLEERIEGGAAAICREFVD